MCSEDGRTLACRRLLPGSSRWKYDGGRRGRSLETEHVEAKHLRHVVFSSLSNAEVATAGSRALGFVLRRLDKGLEPVRMEIEARQQWTTAVIDAVDGFVASYERSYLTSATVVEPISRLNLNT